MRVGPVDVFVYTFPGADVAPAVLESFGDAVRVGAVALIDVVVLSRAPDGVLTVSDLDSGLREEWKDLVVDGEAMTLLSEADITLASGHVGAGEVGLMAAVEYRWAERVAEQVRHSGGTTALHTRVPHESVIQAFLADGAAAT
ncbi:DUF6325 family protein [Arthrobacter sp. B0490]|uniref:DUF6325 family protein n=1 Tax=Arthrobacter sp. B0490 TaxID=2058891 RepID=UPI000CE339D4|nr:DUF6325 family protein [Arthrobacter sp. B0490]